jgi:hypothetical protein
MGRSTLIVVEHLEGDYFLEFGVFKNIFACRTEFCYEYMSVGTRCSIVVRHYAASRKIAGIQFPMRSLYFFSFPNPCSRSPCSWLNLEQKWVQRIFLRVKSGRLTASPRTSADCLDTVKSSTSHNSLGLHGPLQGRLYFAYDMSVKPLHQVRIELNWIFI